MSLAPNESFAGCRLIGRCGHGAYGTVFLAEDAAGRRVALKVFDSPEAGERELRGIRHYMRLPEGNPSLIRIHHAGIEDGRFFYIMELADNIATETGEYIPDTLARRMRRQPRMPLSEALAICVQLLDGLEAMHNAGLLHRDIKPENILFVQGRPKLGDPGMAGDYTHTLSIAGTLGFIPPELFNASARPSPSSDLYALGKVLYCLITGSAPGDFPTMPPDLPPETLVQICLPLAKVCNTLPEKRCLTCAECRAILTQAARPRTGLQRIWHRLFSDRAWRRRILWRIPAVAALLVILPLLLARYVHHRKQANARRQAVELTAQNHQRESIQKALAEFRTRQNALECQLTHLRLDFPLNQRLQELERAAATDLPQALRLLSSLNGDLARLAIAQTPPPVTTQALTPETLRQNARAFGYLESPLGKWHLPPENQRELRRRADSEVDAIFGPNAKIRNGRTLRFTRGFSIQMPFIPPGAFHSPTTNRTESIDYPFWILATECTADLFKHLGQAVTQHLKDPMLPVTNISWNDMLDACRQLEQQIRRECDLPPGYHVRLPTEAEWELAALGTLAPPSAALPIPAGTTATAAHSGLPNQFALYGMDRNLAEVTTPYPSNPQPRDYAVIRGAHFKSKTTGLTARAPMRLDQTTLDTIGFRPVLAPAPDDYFERSWFRGPQIHTAIYQGKAYAAVSSCYAVTNWDDAQALAEKLGARLPEPDTPDTINALYRLLEIDPRFPAPLGLRFKNGAWRRHSDHSPIDNGLFKAPIPPENSQRDALGYLPNRRYFLHTPQSSLPSLILEWPSQEAFLKRKPPACQESFVFAGRRYGILRQHLPATLLPAFLAFVGYKTPIFKDIGEVQKLLQHLTTYDGRIAIGCQRHYQQWKWRDGSTLALYSPADQSQLRPLASIGLTTLAARNGNLLMEYSVDAALVELP